MMSKGRIFEKMLAPIWNTTFKALVYILSTAGSDVTTEVAKNCLKRIRTLRHPNIVTYVEGLESEKFVYIATEYVTPLSTYLDKIDDIEESSMAISWGLHQGSFLQKLLTFS